MAFFFNLKPLLFSNKYKYKSLINSLLHYFRVTYEAKL
jgi:hypothetical protein